MPKKPRRRQRGSGSITWLGPSRALLRISTPEGVRSKTVRVAHRDHGGRGQAEAALATLEAEVRTTNVPTGTNAETLESVLTYYIAHITRLGRRRGTIEAYEAVAKRLPDDLKARSIDTVTPGELDEFYGTLKDRGLGNRTVRTTHAVIRAALRQAVKAQRVSSSPAEDATVPAAPKGTKKRVHRPRRGR